MRGDEVTGTGGGGGGGDYDISPDEQLKDLRPFQQYFTHFRPIASGRV